jgi:hypothetical protein
MIATISINTQNLIKEMKEQEEKEQEIKSHCDYIQELIKENAEEAERQNIKYLKTNECYMNLHMTESEDKTLSEETQKTINTLERIRGNYYFRMMEYHNKNNMLRNIMCAYVESKK